MRLSDSTSTTPRPDRGRARGLRVPRLIGSRGPPAGNHFLGASLFRDLPDRSRLGDCLVLNRTKVFPAPAWQEVHGGKADLLLVRAPSGPLGGPVRDKTGMKLLFSGAGPRWKALMTSISAV